MNKTEILIQILFVAIVVFFVWSLIDYIGFASEKDAESKIKKAIASLYKFVFIGMGLSLWGIIYRDVFLWLGPIIGIIATYILIALLKKRLAIIQVIKRTK